MRQIMLEDKYIKIPRDKAMVGDFVLYTLDTNEVTHIAVIVRRPVENPDNFSVMSAWGQVGEFVHQVADAPPQYGNPTEFWTDRRLLSGL